MGFHEVDGLEPLSYSKTAQNRLFSEVPDLIANITINNTTPHFWSM